MFPAAPMWGMFTRLALANCMWAEVTACLKKSSLFLFTLSEKLQVLPAEEHGLGRLLVPEEQNV